MQIGIVLPIERLDRERRSLVLQHAEDAGYAHVWVGDGLDDPGPAPISALAFVAARSRRLRLGIPTLPAAYRESPLLAGELAMLDQLSQGRLILTVAPGTAVPDIGAEVWIRTGGQGELRSEAIDTFARYGDGMIATGVVPDECVEIRRRAEVALQGAEREPGDFPLAVDVTVRPQAAAAAMGSLAPFALAGVTDLIVRFEGDDPSVHLNWFTEEVKPYLELGDLMAAIEERATEGGWGESPEGLMFLQSISLALVPRTGLELEVARAHARTFIDNFPPMSLPFGDVDQRAARWLAQLLDSGARPELRRSVDALAAAWRPVAPVAAEQLSRWSAGEPPADPREDSPWFQALVALARTELQT